MIHFILRLPAGEEELRILGGGKDVSKVKWEVYNGKT